MNGLVIKILFYIFLMIILYQLIRPSQRRESFINVPNIILIGNIFSDKDHTKFASIKEEIEKDKTTPIGELVVIGNECYSLDDFKQSVKKLKRQNPELDQSKTYAFISIGFQDLLDNVHNCEQAIEIEPHSSKNAGHAKKLPCYTETDIYSKWKEELEYFSETFPQVQITILSAYYLPEDKKITSCGLNIKPNRHLAADIDGWNADLAQLAMKKNWGFIAMDHEFKITDVISGSINFNNNAKRKLAKLIKRKAI